LVNRGTVGVNSSNTVTRQRRDCDLNLGPSVPESSALTTRLPSHPFCVEWDVERCCIEPSVLSCRHGDTVLL